MAELIPTRAKHAGHNIFRGYTMKYTLYTLPILLCLVACVSDGAETGASLDASAIPVPDSQAPDSQNANSDSNERAAVHVLVVNVAGAGIVETELVSGESKDEGYVAGSVVRLSAVPAAGAEFGGWRGDVQDVVNPLEITLSSAVTVEAFFFSGSSCVDAEFSDVLGNVPVATTHPMGSKDYGCLIVDKDDGFPVLDGTSSARFEVRKGDCSSSESYDDCANDRSRHEINEINVPASNEIVVTYTTAIYIPQQSRIRPKGNNILILSQINVANADLFNALAYLMWSNSMKLYVQTHEGFTWKPSGSYNISDDPFDRWFKITYEIYASTSDQGTLKVYVDDELLFTEVKPTLPSEDARVNLKFGIYNAFVSDAYEPFEKQVIYMDGVSKSVQEP